MYLALPWQVVCLVATPVERHQEMGAAVSVGQRELGRRHFLARRLCFGIVSRNRGRGRGVIVRRGVSELVPSAMVTAIGAACDDNCNWWSS